MIAIVILMVDEIETGLKAPSQCKVIRHVWEAILDRRIKTFLNEKRVLWTDRIITRRPQDCLMSTTPP